MYRRRIKKIFENILDVPLFLIIASTGYSKTTSVRRFLNTKRSIKQIWLSLDEDEIDEIWIWQKLCIAIKKTNAILADKLSNYGLPQSNMDMEHFINLIKNNIYGDIVFIIDNFQEIKSTTINLVIETLAYENIPHLHIVILSRTHPSFSYSELSLKGYCYILEQQTIAFNLEDTTNFFEINGFILDEKNQKAVLKYTDGWVSATYLALLCYSKNHSFDKLSNYTELMRVAVYDKFDEDTKTLVMKLSLLENFTIEQAIDITNNKKAITIIRELTINNCFIKYDRKHGIYTLHSMLKTTAFEDMQKSDIDIKQMFHICADWYCNKHQFISAIGYYNKTKEYENVLNIVEQNLKEGLFNKAPTIMLNVFNSINIKDKLKHPIAYIAFIHFYIISIDKIKGTNILLEAKSIYESDNSLKNKNEILGEIYLVERITHFNDIYKMDESLKKAYEFFNGGVSKIYTYNTVFNFASPHNLNIFYNKIGELYNIVQITEKNFWKYNIITNGCGAGYEYLIRAEYCYETGDIETAELLAYKARFKAKVQNQLIIVSSATFILIRIAILNGKNEDLKDYINELSNTISQTDKPFLITQFDIIMGYIYGCLGQIENVPSWLRQYETNLCININQTIEHVYIVFGKVLIKQKKFDKLMEIAKSIMETCKNSNLIFNIIFSYIFNAIAVYNLYGIEKAKPILIEAINIAYDDKIIMPFVETSPEILPIVCEIECDYINNIISMCQKFNEGMEKINCLKIIENLNEREKQIKELLTKGYTSVEIGKILSISPVTVNKILSNIYKILNVKNRVSAVTKIKNL